MGLYDRIHVPRDDARFHCSEGHALDELQSKDFGETMGDVHIAGDTIRTAAGDWGREDRPDHPLNGRFLCYSDCTACPAFVTPNGNIVQPWVEFEMEIVDDEIRRVERVSRSTAEWLETEPRETYMRDAVGPLPHGEAKELQRKIRAPST